MCVSLRLLLLVQSKAGSGGLWSGPRVCSVLQPSGRGELSPATLPFGRSGSAWLLLGFYLWKSSLVLKQLEGKVQGPGATRGERWARTGLCSLERESSGGP